MTHLSRLFAATLVAVLAFTSVPAFADAAAAAAAAAATQRAKDQVAYFNRDIKRAKDDYKFAELMNELAVTKHALVIKRIGKVMIKSKSMDRQMIAASMLAEFKKPEAIRVAAGEMLVAGLGAKKMPVDVIDSAVISIGKLKFTEAVPNLCEILRKGGDPWLLVTTVRVLGGLKDKRALPILLELWERSPVGFSWETGEVSVDTGASGTADQDAAEAAWKKKYGSVKKKGKPPVMLKVYLQEIAKAVAKITGVQMKKPAELRKWMEANRVELKALGVEIPRFKGSKPRKKKDKK